MRGIRLPVFASADRGPVHEKLRSKRFELEFLPFMADGTLSARIHLDIFTKRAKTAGKDGVALCDEVEPEVILERYGDLHKDAKLLLRGGCTVKGKARSMVNAKGENVKARAFIVTFHAPSHFHAKKKGEKDSVLLPYDRVPAKPLYGVMRRMIPFYRLQKALTNGGKIQVHRGGASRYQGLRQETVTIEVSGDHGKGSATSQQATEFAYWEEPFDKKPKWWAQRDSDGNVMKGDDEKPVIPRDDKGDPKFVLVDKSPPIVVVIERVAYTALLGFCFPDMCKAVLPIFKSALGEIPNRFEHMDDEAHFQTEDATDYIVDHAPEEEAPGEEPATSQEEDEDETEDAEAFEPEVTVASSAASI